MKNWWKHSSPNIRNSAPSRTIKFVIPENFLERQRKKIYPESHVHSIRNMDFGFCHSLDLPQGQPLLEPASDRPRNDNNGIYLSLTPAQNNTDGFFAAVMERTK